MPASRPKRKRLIAIILILGREVDEQLEIPVDASIYEVLLGQMADIAPQMDIDETNWTTQQDNIWAVVEDIGDALEPVNESKLGLLSGELAEAIEG